MDFSLILPAISAGSIEMGASALTDTEERQKNYDFVDFLNAGVAWATQPGNEGNVDPNNACGMTVAVQKGTYSDTDEAQGKSEDCEAKGKPKITKLVYATADAAATATILGRAQAYSSDSPSSATPSNAPTVGSARWATLLIPLPSDGRSRKILPSTSHGSCP